MLTGERARNPDAISLYLGNRKPGQARHLARMRRDHERAAFPIQLVRDAFKSVEPICVEHDRRRILSYDGAHEFRRLRMTRNSRPKRQHGFPFHKIVHVRVFECA